MDCRVAPTLFTVIENHIGGLMLLPGGVTFARAFIKLNVPLVNPNTRCCSDVDGKIRFIINFN